MQQQRRGENHDGDGLAIRDPVDEYRFDEWKMAYSRFFEKHFSSGGAATAASAAKDDGDGPLLDRVFPRCDKTARALADVGNAEWLMDLLADLVVASWPCFCERGSDDVTFCACEKEAAIVFKAATVEYHGGDGEDRRAKETDEARAAHSPRHAVAGDDVADDDTTAATVYRHVRAAAHHAISALKCRCGVSTDHRNPCLHVCLVNTVFSEKLHRSYLRQSRRGPRGVETQTSRDAETQTSPGSETQTSPDSETQTSPDPETQTRGNNDDADRVTTGPRAAVDDRRTEKTRKQGGWKLFGWFRSKSDATAKPAVAKPPKPRRQVKYIQVRPYPKKKKPQAVPASAEQRTVVGPEAAAPVTGPPPDDARAGRGSTTNDRDGENGTVESRSSRWSVIRFLCPQTAAVSTASTSTYDTSSRTNSMESSTAKSPEWKTTELSSSSKSVFLCVSSL